MNNELDECEVAISVSRCMLRLLRPVRLHSWPAQHCHRYFHTMSQATQWIVDVYADLPESRQQELQNLQQAWMLLRSDHISPPFAERCWCCCST